jgi:hypothetical protein
MGWCTDQAATYLNGLGYNVVRVPDSDVRPGGLVGRQNNTTAQPGKIEDLVEGATEAVPTASLPAAAANVNGQRTSSFKTKIGLHVIAPFAAVIGGAIGASLQYTNARTISFRFDGVTKQRMVPAEISRYLSSGDIRADDPLFREYVLGNGDLYVITEVLSSKSLVVLFERSQGVGANLKVPAIHALSTATLEIETEVDEKHAVRYTGDSAVVFGFKCYAIGLLGGDLSLVACPPSGPMALSLDGSGDAVEGAAILTSPSHPILEFGPMSTP